ncbi:hypothetical protein B0T17DRAFT_540827 [Bombardia bombarda]|uniref:Transmembrane protein n=1 Tax=Bombardia bombarda TaxID=252184 RepID=A0AA40BVB1_9PEZI|nr:hypothetical protein B0T17DRAFT_540827 [Bombardia bombarda]
MGLDSGLDSRLELGKNVGQRRRREVTRKWGYTYSSLISYFPVFYFSTVLPLSSGPTSIYEPSSSRPRKKSPESQRKLVRDKRIESKKYLVSAICCFTVCAVLVVLLRSISAAAVTDVFFLLVKVVVVDVYSRQYG